MLKEILSISGKPGLFKLINNTANALIVESLLDGKRFPAYSNAKIIALEDISIYTEDEDMGRDKISGIKVSSKNLWLSLRNSREVYVSLFQELLNLLRGVF